MHLTRQTIPSPTRGLRRVDRRTTRGFRTALGLTALTVVASSCGGLAERATEEAVERAVEEAVESEGGANVDVEFDEDGISVESDDGNISLSADADGVEIDGTDADGNEFSLDADEGGIQAESDGGSFDVDSDGSFTATDADGDVTTGRVSGDGDAFDVTVEGEGGDAEFTSGEGIPDQWPAEIPEPEGLDEVVGTYISEGDDENIVVTGQADGTAEDVFDAYRDRLIAAGFEETSAMNQGDEFYSATFTNDATDVAVTAQSFDNRTDLIVAVN